MHTIKIYARNKINKITNYRIIFKLLLLMDKLKQINKE